MSFFEHRKGSNFFVLVSYSFTCENTFESSWKLLHHLTDKHNLNLYRDASTTDDSQERRGTQTPSPLPSESVKSEQNHPITLIMNDDHICIPNLQSNIPMPTTPTAMPYYSDPTTAAAYGTPPLTTSVSTPSISSLINSEDPCMLKARVFVGNLKKSRVSREDLIELFKYCGDVLGATLFKGYFNFEPLSFFLCSKRKRKEDFLREQEDCCHLVTLFFIILLFIFDPGININVLFFLFY